MDASTYEQSLRAAGGGYLTRDFVETAEGLLFAVVANGLEEDRVLSSLRYIRAGTDLRKLDTSTANQLLRECHPDYLFRSRRRDVDLHAVSPAQMVRHYRPAAQLAEIVARPRRDPLEEKVRRLSEIIGAGVTPPGWLGVTGSLLVGAHQARSDIDLVTYGREGFATARERLRVAASEGRIDTLSDALWLEAYARRNCSLTLEEYLWHERRKFNKFSCAGTKVDISCVVAEPASSASSGEKLHRATIRATVEEDRYAFDYPARFGVKHAEVREIVCFTATYAGQARVGEVVEAAGWVEHSRDGSPRLVIGTSREAGGEYIKVIGRCVP